jgi:hypothetical protein
MGLAVATLLFLSAFTLYESHQNGGAIAARAADRDRQFSLLINNQNKIIASLIKRR